MSLRSWHDPYVHAPPACQLDYVASYSHGSCEASMILTYTSLDYISYSPPRYTLNNTDLQVLELAMLREAGLPRLQPPPAPVPPPPLHCMSPADSSTVLPASPLILEWMRSYLTDRKQYVLSWRWNIKWCPCTVRSPSGMANCIFPSPSMMYLPCNFPVGVLSISMLMICYFSSQCLLTKTLKTFKTTSVVSRNGKKLTT